MAAKQISKAILVFIIAVFILVALASFDDRDIGSFWNVRNLCGPVGAYLAHFLYRGFGAVLAWYWPLLLLFISFLYFRGKEIGAYRKKVFITMVLLWSLSSLVAVFSSGEELPGIVGARSIYFLELLTGRIGSTLIVAAVSVSLFFVLFSKWAGDLFAPIKRLIVTFATLGEKLGKGKKTGKRKARRKKQVIEEPEVEEPWEFEEPEVRISTENFGTTAGERTDRSRRSRRKGAMNIPLPDLSLLDPYDESALSYDKGELLMRSELIEKKLKDYGLEGKIREVRPGPVVTTFEFVPAPGVKVSQIASRADDIALALAAKSIRIQAPIPGKGAVGIEIPNAEPRIVTLRELLEHYPMGRDGLWVALGKTVTGEPFFADITDMPHLLIAGATGSGKSVCINSIICSLLFHHTPETLRLILVDPKRLELITYNNIPHLLHPVITDTKDTLKVLRWLTADMDRRYKLLASIGVKNIQSYNRKVTTEKIISPETGERMKVLPYYLTIIDELADIMVTVGNEIYQPITRLSQMARAVGIHLIFATQRPSVDVVTGLIKANFPCRIAFQVTSKTDSRTILDINGAEKLLGNGDMLYLPKNQPLPIRLQGAFISEQETERVTSYWRDSAAEMESIDLTEEEFSITSQESEIDDELFEKAKELVIIHQQGSISLLQRRLRVGYARAARLIDMLEQAGVVGPFEGSKARRVLISREEYERSR